jgi:hypothetical protein
MLKNIRKRLLSFIKLLGIGAILKWNNELQISSENKIVGDLSEAHSNTLVFTGRVYFHYESDVDLTALRELKSKLGELGLRLIFMNTFYAKERSAMERPIVFISHDARDVDIAKEISMGLMKSMCPAKGFRGVFHLGQIEQSGGTV